jgi:putative endonuclease
MYKVYAIKSLTRNYIYVGITHELEERFERHNTGKNKTTAPYKPFKLIYTEDCQNRTEARNREKYLKSGVGKEFLRKLI